jgi:hypothetical protein
MTDIDSIKLKEVIDASKINNKDYEELVKVVLEIFEKIKNEAPNSATFSMAMDCIEKNGKLFVVKNQEITNEEIAETERVT